MAHQLDLLAGTAPPRLQGLGSRGGLWALGLSALLLTGLALWLQQLAEGTGAKALRAEQALQTAQARAASGGPAARARQAAELARLRAAALAQSQLRASLDGGPALATPGYSGHLMALSRQRQDGLWLTRFSVAAEGQAIEIAGRMNDPAHLPGYLRRLNSEPLFRGRQFTQLSLKTLDGGATPPVVEFALRAAAEDGR